MTFKIPGPDIQVQGSGYTFDEALIEARSSLRQTLKLRAEKAMHHDGAKRGVKAAHRG